MEPKRHFLEVLSWICTIVGTIFTVGTPFFSLFPSVLVTTWATHFWLLVCIGLFFLIIGVGIGPSRTTLSLLIRRIQGKKIPGVFWLWKIRTHQIERVMPIDTPKVLAFVLGLSFLMVRIYINRAEITPTRLSFDFIATIVFSVGVWILLQLGAYKTLYRLPPPEYARVTVSGERFSTVLQMISFEIWVICYAFTRHKSTSFLWQYSKDPELLVNESAVRERLRQDRNKIANSIKHLDMLLTSQEPMLQRLLAMKQLAAEQFDIPARRFCDYLVQFSPLLYENRVHKYLSNWEEILELIDVDTPTPFQKRLSALLEENENIYEQINKRLRYQEQILRYVHLHSHLYSFASEHSTSASLKHYIQAISQVAQATLAKLNRNDGFSKSTLRSECIDQLLFLYFKQRAHPGFDLHYACCHLFEIESDTQTIPPRSAQEVRRLNIIETLLKKLQNNPKNDSFSANPSVAQDELEALAGLFVTADAALVRMRKEIIDNFRIQYEQWIQDNNIPQSTNDVFIVTHGYSRYVREVIKYGLCVPNVQPKIFVMRSDDKDSFDSRLMTYELIEKEISDVTERCSTYSIGQISTGDGDLLAGLINELSRVLVVLGAECFDDKRRVVHPRGRQLVGLKEKIKGRKATCTVVVVGEEYKHHKSLPDVPQFYQNHLDRICLYEPEFVDMIITDRKVIREEPQTSP